MRDELGNAWAAFEKLADRLGQLEAITERMVSTCADPIAVDDYWLWKAGSA